MVGGSGFYRINEVGLWFTACAFVGYEEDGRYLDPDDDEEEEDDDADYWDEDDEDESFSSIFDEPANTLR